MIKAGENTPKRVHFITLGCAKNEVDSADMARLLSEAGYGIVDEAAAADAIVVNTCSFIQAAVEESIEAVLDAVDFASDGDVPVIVAGCMPARYGAELEGELSEVAAFVPCADEARVVDVVRGCIGDAGVEAAAAGACCPGGFGDAEGAFAYVKISDGCDRWCSYCTIPMIRGRYHSFSLDEIVADVERCVGEGAREIVFIGQDTGLWGSDFDEPSSLAALFDAVAPRYPDTWFRALYTQPENVTEELLQAIERNPNVCPYLDIPMQHVDAGLLSRMNRKGSREEFSRLVRWAREVVPGIAVRTTLIAGFPGETEEQFEELVDFVETEELDYVGVFAYSREEGTRTAEMDGQLDEDEKNYRAQRLRSVADAVSSQVIAARVGHVYPCLVEGREEDGQLYGRTVLQAPEVDGVTFVDGAEPGDIVDVEIEDTLFYDMEGSVR